MTGFEMFDIGSWTDSNGLLMRSISQVKKAVSNTAARKLSNGIVASIAVGFSTASMASSPVVIRAPVTALAATAPRAATPISGGGNGVADTATPAYWTALISKMQTWQPIAESSTDSPEPLD